MVIKATVDGHLNCFWFEAIVNKIVKNIREQVSVWSSLFCFLIGRYLEMELLVLHTEFILNFSYWYIITVPSFWALCGILIIVTFLLHIVCEVFNIYLTSYVYHFFVMRPFKILYPSYFDMFNIIYL